jgi:hypothetical protein
MTSTASLHSLPPEILLKICQYLGNAADVVRLGSTCKQLAAVAKDDTIWEPLLIEDHDSTPITFHVSFRPGDKKEFQGLYGFLFPEDPEKCQFETFYEAYRSEVLSMRECRQSFEAFFKSSNIMVETMVNLTLFENSGT